MRGVYARLGRLSNSKIARRCQHLTPHAFVSIGVEGLSKDANVIAGVTLSSFPLILRVSKDCMPGLDVRSMSEGAAAGANVSSETAFT